MSEDRSLPVHGGEDAPRGPDRRTMIKLMAVAAAAPGALACEAGPEGAGEEGIAGGPGSQPPNNPLAAGTLWDPDLLDPTVPWDGLLTEDELATLVVLCDDIIPADERSPSASSVGAHEFIDEYVSAPYEAMEDDLVLVRGGLVWLDAEAARRFGAADETGAGNESGGTGGATVERTGAPRFRELPTEQRQAILDDICTSQDVEPRFRAAARFFDKVRDLTATAFYTTPEGMEDIGYVGNRPMGGAWPAPPPEALRHLGLEA